MIIGNIKFLFFKRYNINICIIYIYIKKKSMILSIIWRHISGYRCGYIILSNIIKMMYSYFIHMYSSIFIYICSTKKGFYISFIFIICILYIVCILHTFSNINGKYNIVFFILTLNYTFILVITKKILTMHIINV